MKTVHQNTIQYYLSDNQNEILLNNFLGKKLKLTFDGTFNCIACGKVTKKLFGEGFCYSCFMTSPLADVCILHPEKCQAHEGISRDMEWSKQHCLQPHYVYLAKTSDVKVGVTRQSQIPTRWIDQGADSSIKLAKTPYRQIAGLIEVELKKHFTDKTSWQKMLKNETCDMDLIEQKNKAIELLPEEFKKFIVKDNEIYEFNYPRISIPENIKSLKLDAQPQIERILTGIKGQYLIFENQYVINIRSHSGYNVEIE